MLMFRIAINTLFEKLFARVLASHRGGPGSALWSFYWRRASGVQSAQIMAQAYGAQIVATGLQSSDHGRGLQSSDRGDGPTELRSWRQVYRAQIIVKGLWSSDYGDWPTELRLWRRAYGAQIVSTGLRPTELSLLRSWRRLTELRLAVPAITTQNQSRYGH
jgi:hypothetical protein